MDYKLHYDTLVKRAKNRQLKEYTEKHHIIPRCIGGNDEPENLVKLTPEEHYVAHQLLVKIFPDQIKLIFAAWMLTFDGHGKRLNNKQFGWLRRKMSIGISSINRANAKERTRKSGITQRGKKLSEEHKRKLSKAGMGRKNSPNTISKMSISAKLRPKENRAIMHASPEYREKLRLASKNKRWMIELATSKTSFVSLEEIDSYKIKGWILGRSLTRNV